MKHYILNGLAQSFPTAIDTNVFGGVEITQQQYNDVQSGTARIDGNAIVYPTQLTAEELLNQAKQGKRMEIETAYYNAFEDGYQGNYRAHDKQRGEYSAQLQLLETAKQLGQVSDSTLVTWYGKNGATTQPLSAFRLWCLQYGLWAQGVINMYYAKLNTIGSATTVAQVEAIQW